MEAEAVEAAGEGNQLNSDYRLNQK
jgi:hypothetical protein